MRTVITFFLLLFCLSLQAQFVIPEGTPVVNGYDITYQNTNALDGQKLYLWGNYGSHGYIIDSVVVKKGVATFKNKKAVLPCGVYTIYKGKAVDHSTDIVLNKSNKCVITKNGSDITFSECEESEILDEFYSRLDNLPNDTPDDQLKQFLDDFINIAPESFVSKYLRAIFGFYWEYGSVALTCQTALQILPYTDLAEPRLLFSPIPLNVCLQSIHNCDIHSTDSLIQFADSLLNRCSNPIVKNFYLNELFQLFDDNQIEHEPVLVHLYDHYDHSWISEENERRYERKIKNLRNIITGAKVPELTFTDTDGKTFSTNHVEAKYTVFWFWDSDCDHCQELTPILHKFYQEHANEYDFEVVALEITDDINRWKSFSDEQSLWDWTNLSLSNGTTSTDLLVYFDIATAPAIILIDNSNDHTIITRQITLEELLEKLKTINEER